MNQRLIVAMLAAAFAGGAHAQSSVTLYGIVDTGITFISNQNGHSTVKMDSGIAQSSRWGLKGSEDLGGGLRAVFTLENGFDLNTGIAGQGGSLFGRRAFVGLSSDRFGTLIAGNDYDFLYDYVTYYTNVTQFGASYSFHLGDDIDRLAGEQVHNMVRYETPTIKGFGAGVMYGFSNVAGAFAGSPTSARVLSIGLRYSPTGNWNAPYSFAAAYTKTEGGNGAPGTGGTIAQVALNARSIYTAALAGLVKLGKFSINGVFTYTNASDSPLDTVTANAYEAGLTYRFTPAFSVGAGYTYVDQHRLGKHDIVSAGADYNLSKRTDVFTFVTYQHAFAGSRVAGNFLVVTPYSMSPALPNGVGASSSSNQTAMQVGIRHVF